MVSFMFRTNPGFCVRILARSKKNYTWKGKWYFGVVVILALAWRILVKNSQEDVLLYDVTRRSTTSNKHYGVLFHGADWNFSRKEAAMMVIIYSLLEDVNNAQILKKIIILIFKFPALKLFVCQTKNNLAFICLVQKNTSPGYHSRFVIFCF